MFKEVDIKDELNRLTGKTRSGGEQLVSEARRILNNELYTGDRILDNLVAYNKSSDFAEEEALDAELIFSTAEVKEICIRYRLKFLDSKSYRAIVPYAAQLSLQDFNDRRQKTITDFKLLAPAEAFAKKDLSKSGLLFVKTNHDNYYLLYSWGTKLQWHRQFRYWPMRHFENLFVSIILTTLIITLSLPIGLISLDPKAEYWSGYRAAAFFHLFIFNMGVTAYTTFAFAKNFSSTVWNREQDFD